MLNFDYLFEKYQYVVIANCYYSSADITRNLNMKTEIQNYIRIEMKSIHEEKKQKIQSEILLLIMKETWRK